MQTRMTIKYISYGKIEDTTLFRILKYFTKERKNTLFRLDTDGGKFSWYETDIFIPSLSISKLESFDPKTKYSHEYYVTFMCDIDEQRSLLKLLFNICQLGDPGHTFGIVFGNDQNYGWDGDGSDRITEVNFIENWNKKDFYEYDDNLPKKVLNFDRGCEEIFARLMKCDSNTSPLFDENVRFQLAKDVAKKLSDIQYQKFLEIKNGKDIDEK